MKKINYMTGCYRSWYKHSEKTKSKMSEVAKKINSYGRLKESIEKSKRKIIDSEGNIYESLVDCSKKLGVSVSSVCDVLKGRSKTTTSKKLRLNYYKEIPNDI